MWHLNSNKIVLKPGDTSEDGELKNILSQKYFKKTRIIFIYWIGKYQAEYVTTVAENRYKIGLIIKNVSAVTKTRIIY